MTSHGKYNILTPKTTFGIKPSKYVESTILSKWSNQNIYKTMQAASGDNDFVLHDGPPYANGHIHIGHALNKILKDITNRYQYIHGRNINYIPGWDCHGLPIEWKVEEQYRKDKKNKDDNIIAFRQDCRNYAQKWIDIQRQEFKDLGIIGDWGNAYTTMEFKNEAAIVQQLHKFLMADLLEQKNKPVMWSPIEKTSLAEAEVEYKDIITNTAYVSMPIITSKLKSDNVHAVIWTTTPWTLPGNEVIAINSKYSYVVVKCWNNDSRLYLIAEDTITDFSNAIDARVTVEEYINGIDLVNTIVMHPIYNNRNVKLISADFVSNKQGTGLVHIAPAHGMDDFILGREHNLNTDSIIDNTGCYDSRVKNFSGIHIYKADSIILNYLTDQNRIIAIKQITHSYPHSWRSKKPIIYKTTEQWFIKLIKPVENSLCVIDDVNWFPSVSKNRLTSMIKDRTDWCISRQRTWGVPIMVFINNDTGELLTDYKVNEKIVNEVKKHGCDIWFEQDENYFIDDYNISKLYTKVTDILDVWFDSGSTHSYILNNKQADLYVEGTDQHRGWFQSSLLISTALGGIAPYKNVITHGFVMTAKHKKMSKSDSSGMSPDKIILKYGTDVLRMWVASSDVMADLTINDSVLMQNRDHVQKIRNTLRYCLGNLHDDTTVEIIKYNMLPDLEKYIINRMVELKQDILENVNKYQYSRIVTSLFDFCIELSTLYFNARKDVLYCDNYNSHKRKSSLYVLSLIFDFISLYMLPIMPFTIYEALLVRYKYIALSYLTLTVEKINFPISTDSIILNNTWKYIKKIRATVLNLIEKLRNAGTIVTSAETEVIIIAPKEDINLLEDIELEALFGVSKVTRIESTNNKTIINVVKYIGKKCPRCWSYHINKEELCLRCFNVENIK